MLEVGVFDRHSVFGRGDKRQLCQELNRDAFTGGFKGWPSNHEVEGVCDDLFTYWLAEQRSPVLAVGIILL